VAEYQTNEALEKLNRGIQESKQVVQQQTITLAQDYFGDSIDEIRRQIRENRATLDGLPDQIPGGREESFQMLFQELMDNYEAIEQALDEANSNVSRLDADRLVRQGEIDATDAARREARERGVDLTKVEGTGSDGRIIVSDVVEAAEAMEDTSGEDGAATQAAQRTQDAAGQAAGQAQQAASQVTGQAKDMAGRATDQAGRGVQDTVGGLAGGQQQGGGQLAGVTDQAGQVARGVQDTVGQATDAVGQTVGQADGTVDQATQQAGSVAGGDGDEGPKATSAARRKAGELGLDLSQIQGSGAGGLITIRDVVQS
jgi:pyruvate/2-oxoglutarate dehydrogenase complex dihydrolipoamide acyltransferase (E2) component